MTEIKICGITCKEDIQKVMMEASNKISNFVFDGRTPGGGETFDWGMLKKTVDNTPKIVLAGGLTEKRLRSLLKQFLIDSNADTGKDD